MAQLKSTNITGNLAVTGNTLASKIIKLGGTNDDILMGDGSTTSKQALIDSLEASMEGDTNTWREIKVNDTSILGTGINTGSLNLKAGTNVSISNSGGTVTISSSYTDTDTGATSIEVTGTGNAVTAASYDATTRKITLTKGATFLTSHQSLAAYVKGPSSSTDNAVARFDSTTGKVIQNSRATIDDTGNLKINNSDGGDIGLTLGRGSNADWRLFGSNGNFYIQGNYTTSKQTSFYSVLTLAYNSGNATVKGSVTANGFKHSNSTTGTNDYVLLAGGGTKSLSDFGTGSGNVTGSDLTANYIVLGNGGSSIKKGSYRITTDIESNATNTYLPTAEAVDTFVTSKLSGVGGSDKKTSSSSKADTELKLVGAVTASTDGVETFTNPNCYIGTDNCLYSNGKKVATEEWVETAIKDKITSATIYSEVLYDAEGSISSAVWTPGWRVDTGAWDASVKNNNTAASYTMATVTSSNQTVTLRRPYSPETTHSRWVMEVAASGLHGLSVSGATVTTVSNNKYKIQFAATTNQTITLSKGEATFIIKIVFQTASYQD